MNTQKRPHWIIVRHAHRIRLEGGIADNGLSPRGKRQAIAVSKRLEDLLGRKTLRKATLVSSPKKRCVETLGPIIQAGQVTQAGQNFKSRKIQIDKNLDEGLSRLRVQRFLKEWVKKEGAGPLILCSHGDWIPEFFKTTCGARIDLKKSGWCVLKWGKNSVKVKFTVESLRDRDSK